MRIVLWNSANIVDPQGTLISTIAQGQDITERKAAEEKIKLSETRYRRLFESAKDGILILHKETGEIIDANPFIEYLPGIPGKNSSADISGISGFLRIVSHQRLPLMNCRKGNISGTKTSRLKQRMGRLRMSSL